MKRNETQFVAMLAGTILVAGTLSLPAIAQAASANGTANGGQATQTQAGPADGTGNQGVGPKDGTGNGAPAGAASCTMPATQSNGATGSAQGAQAKSGSVTRAQKKGGKGPGDGSGNQGSGPKNGSGYGAGSGSSTCTGNGTNSGGQGGGRRRGGRG